MDKHKLHINEAGGKNYPEPDVPVEDAWNNMQQLLQLTPPAPATAIKPRFKFGGKAVAGKFLGAAVIAAIIVYVVAIKQKDPKPTQQVYNSGATPRTDTLTDGTIAFLDSHSSITVASHTDREKRITLNNGGCYFKPIITDSSKVWQVQVGPVAVLPGKANVYVSIDSANGTAIVQVQSGQTIILAGDQQLQLAAGESVRFNPQKEIILFKQKANPNLSSYANKVFEFSNTPFKDAARLIEKAYGVQIIVKNNKLYNCTFTTRFDNQTLEEILDIIGYTLAFEYRVDQKKNQVIISGDGCD